MRTTKQLSITLPLSMAQELTQRVASGAYASESEVIRDGLRTLFARDEAVENWLRSEVVAAFDSARSDPDQLISSQELRAHMARLHTEFTADQRPQDPVNTPDVE